MLKGEHARAQPKRGRTARAGVEHARAHHFFVEHARAHHGEAKFKFCVARPVFPMSTAVLGKEHGRAPFQHARADLSSEPD